MGIGQILFLVAAGTETEFVVHPRESRVRTWLIEKVCCRGKNVSSGSGFDALKWNIELNLPQEKSMGLFVVFRSRFLKPPQGTGGGPRYACSSETGDSRVNLWILSPITR
ncbi:hypothetical protein K469DRAFT_290644 [Zopfia rhizophila CBS 207.26]|uniref:Uncharacterized protein n=1 Tax=Zopfia rhizophila CBS 207.26 TaxID=1314779 RepID=A0A6A6DL18_9PEZI|nr:hypothetical protein K469DRAFT_290644 [Zopfia rhizophila CBS 207.26]